MLFGVAMVAIRRPRGIVSSRTPSITLERRPPTPALLAKERRT
jgi:hypothetical protein